MIKCGHDFTCCFVGDGAPLWCFGNNNFGQIGMKSVDVICVPQQSKCSEILFVGCGERFSFLVAKDCIWKCGHEQARYISALPSMIMPFTEITNVACGKMHSMFIDREGYLWGTGCNEFGQLGTKICDFVEEPTRVGSNCKSVHCGEDFTLTVDIDNCLWGFGRNHKGQLGLGNEKETIDDPRRINKLSSIDKVSCGEEHSICLDLEGNLWAFGSHVNGRLGLGDTNSRSQPTQIDSFAVIVDVECGGKYTLCLDNQGSVWAFGTNYCGQLGLGDCENRFIPCRNELLRDIVSISCGGMHSFCIDSWGSIWAFGCNETGQLGLGHIENKSTPQMLPGEFSDILLQKKCMAKSARK